MSHEFFVFSIIPSWFDDSTNIMKNSEWNLPIWQYTKISQETLHKKETKKTQR